MKLKEGAILAGLNTKMRPVLIAAEHIWKDHGQELVVTSGLDGCHSAGSLHYYGLALDLRTRYFSKEKKALVAAALNRSLSSAYDVVVHPTHIHVEYDLGLEMRR